VSGTITLDDGTTEPVTASMLREAPEGALRVLWIATTAIAAGLVIARWP
jgi:hypothetical protein